MKHGAGSADGADAASRGLLRRSLGPVAVVAAAVVVAGGVFVVTGPDDRPSALAGSIPPPAPVPAPPPAEPWRLDEPSEPYGIDPYRGLGAWVDVFDFAPAYQTGGAIPVVGPADLDVMVASGVRTLYLQAARRDDRAPTGLVEPELTAALLDGAHDRGLAVVAWYLPTFESVSADLVRVDLLRRFTTARGDRFDGIGIDIELTSAVPDHAERTRRLVQLSAGVSGGGLPGDAYAAVVLPPTLLQVVNPDLWPGFPWEALAPHYDVWMPMAYWSGRTEASGLRDGFAYTADSVERLRADLDDPDAPVHPVGGIGDEIGEAEVRGFVDAVEATGSIGASIYDYRTMGAGAWAVLRDRLG